MDDWLGCGDDWLGCVGDWGVSMEERAVKTACVCVADSDARGPGTDQIVASHPHLCALFVSTLRGHNAQEYNVLLSAWL